MATFVVDFKDFFKIKNIKKEEEKKASLTICFKNKNDRNRQFESHFQNNN
jgi:hypothetical protein